MTLLDVRDERALIEFVAGPEDSLLGQYLAHARKLTDAPLAFHLFGGLAAMAGAVGSNLHWRGGGGHDQWPNLYVLLLAPSGIMRKSTSVGIPTKILQDAVPGVILSNESSPEQFIRDLERHPTSVLRESEFASLLKRFESSYMNGMKQRLTDLFDCQDEYVRTIKGMSGSGEQVRIKRPALTILAASTLDWLVESLTQNDMRSGFMPRFLFVAPTTKEPEPRGGYWAEPEQASTAHLVKRFRGLVQMQDRARVTFHESRDMLVEWALAHGEAVERGETPDELGGLYSRLGHHLSKICALLALSDNGTGYGEYPVYASIAERGIAAMDWIVQGTRRVFTERVTFSKFEAQAQECLRLVGAGIERSRLLERMKCSSNDLDRLLRTLEERQQIEQVSEQTRGRPRRMVRRTMPDLEVVRFPQGSDDIGDKKVV